jgi:CheY-like chemotaxis protein
MSIVLGFASLSNTQVDELKHLRERVSPLDPASVRAALASIDESAATLQRSLAKVVDAAGRARNIVAGLNSFAKTAAPELSAGDLMETVRSAAKLIAIAMPAHAEFELTANAAPLPVMHDRGKMEQLLVNLCINGMHALGGLPGKVHLAIDRLVTSGRRSAALRQAARELSAFGQVIEEQPSGWIHLWRGEVRPGPYARIAVVDTGSGIDAAIMAKIFDPFFTTKAEGVGTGLGLPSVASIVEAHDGAIHVSSKPGVGTSFTILLPLLDAAAAAAAADTASAEETDSRSGAGRSGEEAATQATAKKARILVIDDEENLADLMDNALTMCGYAVERFDDPRAAWARIQAEPSAFDLVVSDQTMPGMTGLMLAEQVEAIRPDLPVILCTGFSSRALDMASRPRNVRDVLRKPFMPDELDRAVRAVLR